MNVKEVNIRNAILLEANKPQSAEGFLSKGKEEGKNNKAYSVWVLC